MPAEANCLRRKVQPVRAALFCQMFKDGSCTAADIEDTHARGEMDPALKIPKEDTLAGGVPPVGLFDVIEMRVEVLFQ